MIASRFRLKPEMKSLESKNYKISCSTGVFALLRFIFGFPSITSKSKNSNLSKIPIVPEVMTSQKKAKNVILFIGDGMGYPSQTAGRILIGGEGKGCPRHLILSFLLIRFLIKNRVSSIEKTCTKILSLLGSCGRFKFLPF